MNIYLEEFHRAKGLSSVLKNTKVIRMHSVPEKLDLQISVSRIIRAVRERGIRVVYLNEYFSQKQIESIYRKLAISSYVEGLPQAINMPLYFAIFSTSSSSLRAS